MRPLAVGDDMNADKSVLVYTWTPPYDFGLVGGRFAADIERYPPNPGKVFAVLIRQESRDDGVCGSIEHWSWIREARELSGAPVDWENRHEQKIWSR